MTWSCCVLKRPFLPDSGLAVALSMVLIFKIQLSVSLMTGALGMIITRVLNIDEAYQSVDWRTIFLLAGLIPLGIATEKTGTGRMDCPCYFEHDWKCSAHRLVNGDRVAFHCFYPGHLQCGRHGSSGPPGGQHGPLRPIRTPEWPLSWWDLPPSNSFMLPTHQVNALYMGPGRYRSVDFMKAGLIISIVFIVVMIGMIKLIYGV